MRLVEKFPTWEMHKIEGDERYFVQVWTTTGHAYYDNKNWCRAITEAALIAALPEGDG